MQYATTGNTGRVDDAELGRAVKSRIALIEAEARAAAARNDRDLIGLLRNELRILERRPERALMRRVRAGNTIRLTAAHLPRTAADDLAEVNGVLATIPAPRRGATMAGDLARVRAALAGAQTRPAVRRDPLAQRRGEFDDDYLDRLEDAGVFDYQPAGNFHEPDPWGEPRD